MTDNKKNDEYLDSFEDAISEVAKMLNVITDTTSDMHDYIQRNKLIERQLPDNKFEAALLLMGVMGIVNNLDKVFKEVALAFNPNKTSSTKTKKTSKKTTKKD